MAEIETEYPGLDAERGVLGSVLIEAEAIPRAAALLQEEDFWRPAHRLIYGAMLALSERGEPVDLVTLSEELRSRAKLDEAGGIAYLTDLAAGVPTAARVDSYARTVREAAAKRRATSAALTMQQMLAEGNIPAALAAAEAARVAVEEATAQSNPLAARVISDADMLARERPPIDWVIPGVLPAGELGILAGADGTNKSYLAVLFALSAAYGLPLLGGVLPAPDRTGEVLYISGEDDGNEITRRLQDIRAELARVPQGPRVPETIGRVKVVPLDGQPMHLMVANRQAATPEETPEVARLRALVQEIRPRLIILDPLVMFHALSEVDNQHMDSLARCIIRIARSVPGCAALVVHHAGQDAVRTGRDDHMLGRGGTGLNSAARAVITVRKPTETEAEAFEAAGEIPSLWRAVRGPKISRGPDKAIQWLKVGETGVPSLAPPPAAVAERPTRGRRASTRTTSGLQVIPGGRAVEDVPTPFDE